MHKNLKRSDNAQRLMKFLVGKGKAIQEVRHLIEQVAPTTANVLPRRMKEIVELCAAGDFEAAACAHEKLLPIMKHLFTTSNPILVKQALACVGFPVGGVRLPLVDATAEQTAALEEVLRSVGALD